MFTINTIGLHVRRTDNKLSIKNNPISKYQEYVKYELKKNDDTNFYLATDDDKVKSFFRKEYGDKIITIDIDLLRSSKEGMISAVVDLFCLAKCKKIYGSSYSTYSYVASKLYNAELII